MSDVIIKVQDLKKSFEKLTVLDGISTEIKRGEVVVVIGPSGCGKSTFLRCLNLLETPTEGHIFFDGTDLTEKNVNINLQRRKMMMVFQHFNLFPHLTILENLTVAPRKLKGLTEETAKQKAMALLELVRLADNGRVTSVGLIPAP